MFVYSYRIYDRYRRPVVSLAVLCDDQPNWRPDRFEYRKGATYVDSPISELLDGGVGVCQDFVHLGLSLLRHQGIAGRYVSGYLFAANPGGGEESIEVETHAWLEALLPDPSGSEPVWVGKPPLYTVGRKNCQPPPSQLAGCWWLRWLF